VSVALDALWERVAEFGDHPYLITVGTDGSAHVVSVTGRVAGGAYVVGVGKTSAANVGGNSAVSLLWPPADGGPYALIVDGTAQLVDDGAASAVQPTRAVLHRRAGITDDLPSCVRLVP
jgi:hypothetical protein